MALVNVTFVRGFQKASREYLKMEMKEKVKLTVPQRMAGKILRIKEKNVSKSVTVNRSSKNKTPLLLSCKRTEYNHYIGQSYNSFEPSKLASHGWKHRKSDGDHFTIMCHKQNPAQLQEKDSTRFTDFGLNEQIIERLQELNLCIPTNVQKLTIPRLLRGENLICAAETGSGKTYAYLMPLLSHLLEHNQTIGYNHMTPNSPRCIVISPTKELAQQILNVTAELTDGLPVETHAAFGFGGTISKRNVHMDMLIVTPGVLRSMLATGYIKRSRLISMVLDEADSLVDDSFIKDLRAILHELQARPSQESIDGMQMVLASATFPRNLEESVGNLLPLDAFHRVTTSHLHHLMPHIEQTFIKIKTANKLYETVKIIGKQKRTNSSMLIFCNKSDTCYYLSKSLAEMGIHNVIFTGAMADSDREDSFQEFQDGRCDILVCSDVGSRGLDTTKTTHVLNYDFPYFISDYIHRAGRVGRIGSMSKCLVTSFVTHKWDVDLVWNIEMSARNMSGLNNVNANIKRKLQGRHISKSNPS